MYERVAKPLIPWPVCKKAQRAKRCIFGCEKVEKKSFGFGLFSYLKDSAFTEVKRDAKFSTRLVKGVLNVNRR